MDILLYAALFLVGMLVGGLLGFFAHYWLISMQTFQGTIHITRAPDKTVFSLELDDDPEELAYKPMVIFKVETTEAEEIRD